MSEPPDEFEWIKSLAPLTRGDRRALGLADDAAVIPSRPGFDLVISKDAMVGGVHTLVGETPGVIARRLLRTSLSDLAAKAAEPFGYLLMTAWPADHDRDWQAAFAEGLADDGALYRVALLGGDTVATAGPLVVSATVLGWVRRGRMVKRSTARTGDLLMVCGAIGDGWLGLKAAKGEIADPDGSLAGHYRLPTPLLSLRAALDSHVRAAADVSDGLLADAAHVAEASGLGVLIDVGAMPISPRAASWLSAQKDDAAARLILASGGDDYALACAVDPKLEGEFAEAVRAAGVLVATAGRFTSDTDIQVVRGDRPMNPLRGGWRHR
ncbi:MAG TPA: thiamine-phosphate kinase [Caulobacteraceae bacterium]